jgi:hypothetical protein
MHVGVMCGGFSCRLLGSELADESAPSIQTRQLAGSVFVDSTNGRRLPSFFDFVVQVCFLRIV